MTAGEYNALPAFFRAFPKERLEQQYAANAATLRTMQGKAERTGKTVGGLTADQLRASADRFTALSVAR